MKVIYVSNVRDALPSVVGFVLRTGKLSPTRAGRAYVIPYPVTIVYSNPKHHVLLNPVRDANPFFHLMEAMWMLAGRNDGKFLNHYIKGFSEKYGVDGIIPDAYGQRWRHGLGYDQLAEIISQLKTNPNSRQAVLQMWGAGKDDLRQLTPKPCNLVASFHIHNGVLDMTVFNRSNDLIFGCLGANAVHFAILQEYIASMIGVKIGTYYQITTNLHLYEDHLIELNERIDKETSLTVSLQEQQLEYGKAIPLMENPEFFNEDLFETMFWIDGVHRNEEAYSGNIASPFLGDIVLPMAIAHQHFKNKRYTEAMESMDDVIESDWKQAGTEWLQRRIK
jgi:hypothetical protein